MCLQSDAPFHLQESTPEGSNSLRNEAEAKMALAVYRELVHRYPTLGASAMVAVISPYKAQVNLLKEMFKQALGPDASKLVDINSIDGFQVRGRWGWSAYDIIESLLPASSLPPAPTHSLRAEKKTWSFFPRSAPPSAAPSASWQTSTA